MSHKIPIPPKNDLQEIYDKFKSISKTSKYFKTTNPIIRKWLDFYDIPRYTHKEAVKHDFLLKTKEIPDKEDLEFLYNNVSISDIREMYGIGQETFYQWLSSYKIERLDLGTKLINIKKNNFNKKYNLTKEQIEKDYKETQCMGSLSKKYKCSMTTIKKLFKIYNIEVRFAKSSVGQNEINDYIQSLGFTTIKNDRKIIFPLELDIIIPEKKIAIEYCGIYFHSETYGLKNKNYHLNKHNLCEKNGYKLITIFDSEWKNKQDIIKSVLACKLGVIEEKIYARKTQIKELLYSDIKQFENDNHLQGSRPASKYYGLFYKNVLVMTISMGKSRFNKNYKHEMVRLTTRKNTIVIGGLSKLLKHIQPKNCLTYCDKRYGTGEGYKKVGFTYIQDSAPNYFYFHKNDSYTLYSRNKFQKHKIKNIDNSKSEYENMLNQGYDRIWDCGNKVFVI